MSIDELEGFRPAGATGGFDRTPPQDVAAEQSVLGGMMISKDAIADVVEQLRGTDFYRPAHEVIYDAILDLYGRGEPADAVTVAAELTKRGDIGRIGGAPYLHTLISMVPTAANAGYYARIVRERAVLRRLVEAGTRIVQLGYATDGGDVDDIVNNAQAEVYAVTERRTAEDYLRLGEVIGATVDEIEAAGNRGEGMIGVPTGFADLDRLTNGLHPGQMIVVAARPAVGKALALDTPLPTPTGWTTMGQVAVGDLLLGADGRSTRVVAATEVMRGRPCLEVEFSDGAVVVADAEHQWCTTTVAGSTAVRTTRELAATLWAESGRRGSRGEERRLNHTVPLSAPLSLPPADLPFPPYVVGSWLGARCADPADGTAAVYAAADADEIDEIDEIAMYVESEVDPAVVDGTVGALVGPGLRVPAGYLRADEDQRRALLAGVLDRLGRITASGCVQVPGLPAGLAGDLRELVVSLGYECGLSTPSTPAAVDGRAPAAALATIAFCSDQDVFRVE